MLRSLLTSTALVALLAGGTAVAQTDKDATMKPDAAAEVQGGAEATAEGGATTGSDLKTEDMKAEGEALPDADDKAAAEVDTDVKTDAGTAPEGEMKAEGEATQSAARATGFVTEQDESQVLATEYIGQPVVNSQDETVGDISDLVMDNEGRVTAAVIGVGGFLGIGEKLVGVPLEAIDVRTDEDGNVTLVMQSTREELEAAPEFVDLEEKMEAQEAARQEQELQQQRQQMAPATGTGAGTGAGTGTGTGAGTAN